MWPAHLFHELMRPVHLVLRYCVGVLEVKHLLLIRAIADEGGPTKAAARLHLTQSAVSHQLAELEGRLGVVLFSRVRRRLRLTAAGEKLLDASRRLLDELDQVERDLHRTGRAQRKSVRIAVESFTSYSWLPSVVAAMAKERPLIDVRIVPELRHDPISALLDGKLDLAIVSTGAHDRDLVSVDLGEDEWTLILGVNHPLAKRPWLDAKDLQDELLLVHDAPRTDIDRLRNVLAAEKVTMPRVSKIPLTEVLAELVRDHLGVGLVSRWAVAPFELRGDIVARRFTKHGLPERWAAVYQKNQVEKLPLPRITKLIREYFSTLRATLAP